MNNTDSNDVVDLPRQFEPAFTIFRRPRVQAETGYSRSTIYLRITEGLLPKPIRLGSRAVGWPAREIAVINEARIGGASDAELRELVQKLMRARCGVPEDLEQYHTARPQAERR